ncbi:hypothetical protein IEQ34_002279 [Dendrobium chrysotoxum]|uniref:Thioredoxin domain-containing protein n=1 Tax=Dendrobium chrysotoxum TaxID=161865 RepID=A0AAV7HJG4_DENCH|nr:hypothetical protein IEQ34_002279 [Dendrobium chrysotoxum]
MNRSDLLHLVRRSRKKVTAKELEEIVRGERSIPLVLDFYATWCGPCIMMAQDLEMMGSPERYDYISWVDLFKKQGIEKKRKKNT